MNNTETSIKQNVMINGSPAAKAEVIVRLIYMDRPEILQQVYAVMGEREINRVVGLA